MSTSSDVPLGVLRLQAKQRASMENNPAITDPEWNSYISNSYKELYDLLISAYGNDYYIAVPYQVQTTGTPYVALPDGSPSYLDPNGGTAPKFYKLAGVDLQYSGSPSGWITLRNFEFIDRNRFSYPNTVVNLVGYTNIRYKLMGNNLYLGNMSTQGQALQIWYAPAPTSLQYNLIGATTISTTTVTFSDVTGLVAGMSISGENIQNNTTIISVNSTLNTIVISRAATSTILYGVYQMWIDSTTVDGISGWEEYVIIDAAIKAGIKTEEDVAELKVEKFEMRARIESLAEGRDQGQASHVSDAMGANGYGYDGYGDGGNMGGGFGGGY